MLDASKKLTYKGVQIIAPHPTAYSNIYIIYVYRDSTLDIFSSNFINTYRVGTRDFILGNRYATMNVYNTVLDGVRLQPLDGALSGSNDIYDVTIKNTNTGFDRPKGATIDKILLYNNDYHLYFYTSYVSDVSNLIGKNANTKSLYMRDISVDPYLTDCEFDIWSFYWHGTSTAEVHRQYEFDLNVTNATGHAISGATVDINSSSTDPNCFNNRITTDANGQIETQTVTMGYYNQTGNQTIYSCEPYYLTIKKPTYQSYLNTSMTFNTKTDLTIALRRTLGSGSCDKDITYDGTKIIINDTDVTAQDIYNCDDFNAWDCWTTEDLISYKQDCQIYVGTGSHDASVYFYNISITQPSSLTVSRPITVSNKGNLTFGNVWDEANYITDSGVTLTSYSDLSGQNVIYCSGTGGRINIYDSKISFLGYYIGARPFGYIAGNCPIRLWNSMSDGAGVTGNDFNIYNTRITHTIYGSNPLGGTSIEDVTIDNVARGMQLFGGTATNVASFKMRNVTESQVVFGKTFYRYIFMRDTSADKFLQNGDIDKPWLNAIQYYCTTPGLCTGGVYINYTVDIKTIDNKSADLSREIIGANISWYNRTNGFMGSVLTDSNGEIATQSIPILYAYENDSTTSCGSASYDRDYCWTNYTEYQPIRFVITKPGYETLNFTANLTEKTKWTLPMKTTLGSGVCNVSYSYTSATNVFQFWGTHDDGTNITFQDLYDCDDTDVSFDCISTDDLTSYTIKCKLEVGDGSETWFADENVQVSFVDGLGTYILETSPNSNFRLGKLIDADAKTTENGCQIFTLEDSGTNYFYLYPATTGSVEIYDTSISNLGNGNVRVQLGFGASTQNIKVYNSKFSGLNYLWFYGAGVDVYNIDITDSTIAVKVTNSPSFAEDMRFWGGDYYINLVSGTSTFKNPKGRGATSEAFWVASFTEDFYLINSDFDRWDFYFQATVTGLVHRQYELDLTVINNQTAGISYPIADATVHINTTNSSYPQCFNNVTTTNSLGMIDTQVLTSHTYTQITSQQVNTTICNPYRFLIQKDGYETLNFTANITEKTDWTLALIEGVTELTLIKNIQYSDENSTHVNYTITDQVINTGTINVSNIVFQDPDISAPFVIDNLEVNETSTTSGTVIVAKGVNNEEETFVSATATVGIVVYSSNQPSVLIPGTGGPADVSVSVPSSVTVGETITGNITITNVNPDIGQDFTVDYMITSLDGSSTYSSGQKTVYVGASSTNSTLGPLTAPNQAGTYKYKTMVYWIGGNASASASFTVEEEAAPTLPTPSVVSIVGKGVLEISEYPDEMIVEQGGVEFYSLLVKNIGTASLHNIKITLDGIPQDWYTTLPEEVEKIYAKDEQDFILKVKLLPDVESGIYSILINATANENSTQVASRLKVVSIVVEALRVFDIQIATLDKLYKNEEGNISVFIENLVNENITATASLILPEGISTEDGYVIKTIGARSRKY